MAGRESRRRYRTAQVLEQLFAMPSDDESVDGMEDSDDDTIATVSCAEEAAADDVSVSGETDDDDDILYELVDPNSDTEWSDDDGDRDHASHSSATTDDEETEWKKDVFSILLQ